MIETKNHKFTSVFAFVGHLISLQHFNANEQDT